MMTLNSVLIAPYSGNFEENAAQVDSRRRQHFAIDATQIWELQLSSLNRTTYKIYHKPPAVIGEAL
jgi:hypothetical protein